MQTAVLKKKKKIDIQFQYSKRFFQFTINVYLPNVNGYFPKFFAGYSHTPKDTLTGGDGDRELTPNVILLFQESSQNKTKQDKMA